MVSDREAKKFRKIFQSVADDKYWKNPTKPITLKTHKEADLYVRAITFFVGGAELKTNKDGTFTATSKGYYHYIGA